MSASWAARVAATLAVASLGLVATAAWQGGAIDGQPRRDGFPHAKHAKVAPSCAGCHAGIGTGDVARAFPAPTSCAECHDGVQEDKVTWTQRQPRPSLLRFVHDSHFTKAPDEGIACRTCHAEGRDTAWMRVHRAAPEQCIGCHEHQATEHLSATAVCSDCHRKLTDVPALPAARIERFPTPPSHEAADFVARHGPTDAQGLAQCATCHARESCARCHVNAATLTQVQALAPDPRVRALMEGKGAAYPIPETHEAKDFDFAHGPLATRATARCANCHTRQSCTTCHIGTLGRRVIAQLPIGGGAAPGVRLELARRPGTPPPLEEVAPPPRPSATFNLEAHDPSRRAPRSGDDHAPRTAPAVPPAPTPPAAAPRPVTATPAAAQLGRRPLRLMPATWTGQLPGAQPSAPQPPTAQPPATQPPRKVPLAELAARQRRDTSVRRVSVHPIGFDTEHGGAAASGELRCQGCHEKRWCADCHGGEARRRYHPANFVARHAPESYGMNRDCAQCHNAEVFCRGCHVQSGLGTRGRLDDAFHTAQPLWLLQHGRAARSSLESCTTCHGQRECMQCHSGLGLRVNPHGRNFPAARLATKNRDMCFSCHLTDPLAGR
jgi:hypothetical protein